MRRAPKEGHLGMARPCRGAAMATASSSDVPRCSSKNGFSPLPPLAVASQASVAAAAAAAATPATAGGGCPCRCCGGPRAGCRGGGPVGGGNGAAD